MDNLFKTKTIESDDLAGIYRELADVIGIEATILLHENFKGQQINLPIKLYTKEYVAKQVKIRNGQVNIKEIAREYGYTERRLRQILKELGNNKSEG